jgi:hypothetical protein
MSEACGCGHAVGENAPCIDPACPVPECCNTGAGA